jgi:Homeodomain-like domain
MRTGIGITLEPGDRRRPAALARDRNAPHKHVWRAEIILLSADSIGTHKIMRRTGKSKTCVWRWQERFMQADNSPRRLPSNVRHGFCRGGSIRRFAFSTCCL